MAIRIKANRPYYPRVYQPRPAAGARGGGKGVGGAGGGDLFAVPPVPTSTGNWGSDLTNALINLTERIQKDKLANQLMNIENPPRAGLVSPGVNPRSGAANIIQPGVPTQGTLPQRGGVDEYRVQQQAAADAAAQRSADLKEQMDRARLQNELAKQGPKQLSELQQAQLEKIRAETERLRNPPAKKEGKYVPGSTTPDDEGYYNVNHQQADFDAQNGKGAWNRLLANSGYIKPDPATGKWVVSDKAFDSKGNPTISVDDDGNVTLPPQGAFAGAYIPADTLVDNMKRYDATLNHAGQKPRFSNVYSQTQNPQSGIPSGDKANPYLPKSTLDLNTIPSGSYFVSPQDGKVYAKQPSAKQAETTTSAPPPPTESTSTSDQSTTDETGGQSDEGDTSAAGAAAQPPVQLAGMTAPNTPGSFDVGQPQQTGGDQSTSLADALRQTRAANQLRGIV